MFNEPLAWAHRDHKEFSVYYAMTRLHFEETRFNDLLSRAESTRDEIEGIDGLQFAELIKTGDGEGMIIAVYDIEPSDDSMGHVLGKWNDVLTSTPHGHAGTVVLSYGDSPGR